MALAAIAATLSSAFVLILCSMCFTVCATTIFEAQAAVKAFFKNILNGFLKENRGAVFEPGVGNSWLDQDGIALFVPVFQICWPPVKSTPRVAKENS